MNETEGLERAQQDATTAREQTGEDMIVYLDPELARYAFCTHAAVAPGGTHAWINPAWIVWSTQLGPMSWEQTGQLYRR